MHKQNLEVLVERRTQELSTSEQRYRGMFENSADAILLISLDGYIRDANPEACRLYGYEHDEFIGKHGSEFVHPEHAWKFANALAAILVSGQNYEVESVDVRKDGTPFQIEVRISPFNHLGEQVMLCSIRDITERKKLEGRLQEQQLHLESLVQQRTIELSEALDRIQKITSQVPGLVYQLQMCPDGSFCMPYASSAINDIFRLSPGEVCGDASLIFAHVHPSDSLGLLASIHASARDMAPWHYEFRTKFDDGMERWLQGNALPQWKADGSVLWHGFITDVTEHKQSAAALQRSEQHYLAVSRSANDAIITAASDGRILGWNASAERMFGYTESEILGQELTVLMPQRFRARHTEGLIRASGGGATKMIGKTVEIAGLRKDGSEFPLEISLAQYLSEEGWYCSAIIRDITQRKQAEQRLSDLSAHLQNVREEEKARIAREIHDDLGGTLTALKMNTHWLEDELSAISEAAMLGDYVRSMSQLLDEAVLATRRIITDLRPSILDDLGLLAAIEWHAESFYKRTGIVCCVNCVENAGKVDQQRSIALFRIFQEALTNVARHSGASSVEVEYHDDGHEIALTVSDNGRGIKEGQDIAHTSYGIRGMRERVEQLGGEIRFACPPTGGLSLIVILSMPDGSVTEEQT
jgi:PAS domain S-box-containing protein